MNCQTANYVIFKDENNLYSLNSDTGDLEYSGTDATKIIKSTVDSLINNGKIFIRNGTYNLSSVLDLSDKKFYIEGEGFKTILKKSGNVININNTSDISYEQSLNNLQIDGIDKTGNGLYLYGCHRNPFNNIAIRNCDIGLVLRRSIINYINNISIRWCNTGTKILSEIGDSITPNANVFIGGTIEHGGKGIHLYGQNSNNKFIGMCIEGNSDNDILLEATYNGVDSEYLPDSNIFIGNYFENTVSDKVHIEFKTNNSIYPISNVFEDNIFTSSVVSTVIHIRGNRNIFLNNNAINGFGSNQSIYVSGNNNIIMNTIISRPWAQNITWINSGTNNIFGNNANYKTADNILSPTFPIDSVGIKTVTMTHSLDIMPAIQDCYLTIIQNTPVDDWAYNLLKIVSTDSRNVIAKINISIPSKTIGASAKLGLRVGKGYD